VSRPNDNLAERIFQDLQARLLGDTWAPGARLPAERQLSAQLDTTRNTLREAVRMLEQRRLVSVRHGQGVTVLDFRRTAGLDVIEPFLRLGADPQERVAVLADLLRVRTGLFELVVTLAAERATQAQQERLAERAASQLAAFEAGDRAALARGDLDWLDALVDAAGSLAARWMANTLLEAYASLTVEHPSLWLLEPTYPTFMRELIDAIAAGDAAAARGCTRAYYDRNDARVLALLDRAVGATRGDPASADPLRTLSEAQEDSASAPHPRAQGSHDGRPT